MNGGTAVKKHIFDPLIKFICQKLSNTTVQYEQKGGAEWHNSNLNRIIKIIPQD
jgi:hypothetical protein